MSNLWANLRKDIGPKGEQHMIHVEFGHFSNIEIFELFDRFAVQNADSLGMNEVEMKMILDHWRGELIDINAEANSTPTIEEVLEQTAELFNTAIEK